MKREKQGLRCSRGCESQHLSRIFTESSSVGRGQCKDNRDDLSPRHAGAEQIFEGIPRFPIRFESVPSSLSFSLSFCPPPLPPPPSRYDRRVENYRLRKGKLVAALPADTVLNCDDESRTNIPSRSSTVIREAGSWKRIAIDGNRIISGRDRRFKFRFCESRVEDSQEIQSRRESLKASTSPQRQFVLRTFPLPPRFSLGH